MAPRSIIMKAPVFLLTVLLPAAILSKPIAAPEARMVTVEAPPVIVTVTVPVTIGGPSPSPVAEAKAAQFFEKPNTEINVITTMQTVERPQPTPAPTTVEQQSPPPVVAPAAETSAPAPEIVAPAPIVAAAVSKEVAPAPETAAPAAPVAAKVSSILSSSSYDAANFKDQMLLATNFFRSQHGAADVTWNDALAKQSSDWVAGCHFAHSGMSGGGENIAAGSDSVASTVDGWGLERSLYNFDTGNALSSQDVTGHFTQLVWKDTTSIGCAVNACSSYDNLASNFGKYFVTCRYASAGNIQGNNNAYYIKNVGKFSGDLTKGVVASSA